MKKLATKQKLINLVSALERDAVIDYFYTLLTMQLYGTADCPDSFVGEVCKMHDEYEKRRKQKEAERENTKKTGIDKEVSDCFETILKDILALGNRNKLDSLKRIQTLVADACNES